MNVKRMQTLRYSKKYLIRKYGEKVWESQRLPMNKHDVCIRTMILYNLFWIRLLSFSICSRFSLAKIFIHVSRERRWNRPPPSSSSSSLPACSCARKYISWRIASSLWLHQFSFTVPPPYFHEVKLVFANDPRTDVHAGSHIGVFDGKCRSSRIDDVQDVLNNP